VLWITEDPGGPLLSARLEEHPVLAPDVALQHVLQVGQGVLAAHTVGLVHGDLDPANVHLVGHNDRARLAWGGLATRVERSGMDAGRGASRSLAEVAPEVLGGRPPTVESDVYGLCALLYRLLAGQPPFLVRRGQGPPPGLGAGETLPPLPEWVPARLADAVASGLPRDPLARVPTVSELLDRLSDAEHEVRGMPVPPGAWAPEPGRPRTLTPSTASRTSGPTVRRDELDPVLTNTPPSLGARGRVPPPRSGLKSLVPSQPVIEPRPRTPVPGPSASAPPSLLAPAVVVGAAVVVGFALLGGFGLYATSRDPAPAPLPAPAATVAAPAPAPAAPSVAVLTLRTDPPGAEVWEGDERLGVTPVDVVLEGGPADPPRAFELRLPGYATHTVRQPWSASRVEQVVPLQKLAPSARPRPTLPPIKEER
jgi:hypothetical protein